MFSALERTNSETFYDFFPSSLSLSFFACNLLCTNQRFEKFTKVVRVEDKWNRKKFSVHSRYIREDDANDGEMWIGARVQGKHDTSGVWVGDDELHDLSEWARESSRDSSLEKLHEHPLYSNQGLVTLVWVSLGDMMSQRARIQLAVAPNCS